MQTIQRDQTTSGQGAEAQTQSAFEQNLPVRVHAERVQHDRRQFGLGENSAEICARLDFENERRGAVNLLKKVPLDGLEIPGWNSDGFGRWIGQFPRDGE